jgi:hypothetical protein
MSIDPSIRERLASSPLAGAPLNGESPLAPATPPVVPHPLPVAPAPVPATPAAAPAWVGKKGLDALMAAMGEYMNAPDKDVVVVALATGVARWAEGDPLWLMLVHPSSGGKSEVNRLLDGVADERLKDVTLASLLSMSTGKNARPVGLLTNYVGENALFTISDLSPMLGDTRQSGGHKVELWNALRDVYDGEYSRRMHAGVASWNGRVTMLAAVTPEIDRFSAYADALGTRWVQYRPPATEKEGRRENARRVLKRGELNERRAEARDIATLLIEVAVQRIPQELPPKFEDMIVDAADLTAYGRVVVPRGWDRKVEGVVYAEEPARLAGQLRMLTLGALAIPGVDEATVFKIVRRAALSSMPQARARVIEVLAAAEQPLSARHIAAIAGLAHTVAVRALEDWQLIGFAESAKNESGAELVDAGWTLTTEHAATVRRVGVPAVDIAPPAVLS